MGSTPINISASRSAGILGISKWSTPIQEWMHIMEAMEPGFCANRGYKYEPPPDDDDKSAAFRWGHAFEDSVIKLAEQTRGGDGISDREAIYGYLKGQAFRIDKWNTEHYITCHIDGRYKNTNILHEGKTTFSKAFYKNWGEPGTDHIPTEYQSQCQHQLICTGANEVIVSVLVFPKSQDEWEKNGWEINPPVKKNDLYSLMNENIGVGTIPDVWAHALNQMGYFHQYHIHPNPTTHEAMLAVYDEFWNKNVKEKTPPNFKNLDDVKKLFPEPKGIIIATEQLERWSKERDDISAEIGGKGPLSHRKDELNGLIAAEMCRLASQHGVSLDDEGTEKLILMDSAGNKLRSYGKEARGTVLR